MTLALLATGVLVKAPERRTSVSGKDYAIALVRVPVDGEEALLVSAIAFSTTAVEALLAHARGDSIAVAGRGKLRTWEQEGAQRHGIAVTVERVLSAYMLEKRRHRVRADAGAEKPAAKPEPHVADLDRVARVQASRGMAQVLTAPGDAGGLSTMVDDIPF